VDGEAPPRRLTRAAIAVGARRLAAVDPDLAAIHRELGDPPLWGRAPGFATLVRIILEQQVSLDSARTLHDRLARELGGIDPGTVHAAGVDGLRSSGLTRQKAASCHGLAARVRDGRLDLGRLARRGDAEARRELLAVPGLGPWSVDIYFVMALRRPDIWPQGDLALAAALRDVKGLPALPSRDEQHRLAAAWTPWRSVAARLLWARYLDDRGRTAP
jgi:DNA-3-methyladenine glycosylase II